MWRTRETKVESEFSSRLRKRHGWGGGAEEVDNDGEDDPLLESEASEENAFARWQRGQRCAADGRTVIDAT